MAILSDGDILWAMKTGKLEIEDFNKENLTPNGYDLTIEEVMIPCKDEKCTADVAKVPPMTRFVVSTKEYVRFSGEVTAQLWIKTSWARKGVLASFGKIDAGFEGTLTLAAFNSSDKELEIPIGKGFAQMVFERMHSVPLELYEKRSGHFQGQRGVTLEKIRDD